MDWTWIALFLGGSFLFTAGYVIGSVFTRRAREEELRALSRAYGQLHYHVNHRLIVALRQIVHAQTRPGVVGEPALSLARNVLDEVDCPNPRL